MRTTLESGAWVEHRPVQDLKGKDKRALAALSKAKVIPDENGDISVAQIVGSVNMFEFVADQQDAAWALLLTAWSYDLPLPAVEGGEVVNADSFGELPLDDFEALEQLFAPYQAKLSHRPDPKGTTTSSSNGSSRASAGRGSPTG